MKKLFQISIVFLYAFLLNGNGFLYAHTNQDNSIHFLENDRSNKIDIELINSCLENEFTNTDNQFSISTLQTDSFPTKKAKNKRFKSPLFEKEEKEKEDKSTSLDELFSKTSSFVYFLNVPLFDRFYHYNKNYLHVSESLNYFLFYKCYIPFQVFRL